MGKPPDRLWFDARGSLAVGCLASLRACLEPPGAVGLDAVCFVPSHRSLLPSRTLNWLILSFPRTGFHSLPLSCEWRCYYQSLPPVAEKFSEFKTELNMAIIISCLLCVDQCFSLGA